MSIQWHAGVPLAASPHQLTAIYRDCFDYRNTLLSGSRDRAYASGRDWCNFTSRAFVRLETCCLNPTFPSTYPLFSPATRTQFPFRLSSQVLQGATISKDFIYLKTCRRSISVGYPAFAFASIGPAGGDRCHPRLIPSHSHTKLSHSEGHPKKRSLIVCP